MSSKNDEVELIERERQVIELRRAGYTFDEVARAVGYSNASGAWQAYRRALKRTLVEAGTEELRQNELERLERAHRAVWKRVLEGDDKAINTMLRLSERRSRLLGLDAPTRIAAEVTTYEGGTDIDREVARLAELLASAEGRGVTFALDSSDSAPETTST